MSQTSRAYFDGDDLRPVDESQCVILASGGPLMNVECVERTPDSFNVVCSWWTPEGVKRAAFDARCLRQTVPYIPTEDQGE